MRNLSLILLCIAVFIASFVLISIMNNNPTFNVYRVKKYSGAFEALDFWNQMRAYPGVDISPDKYYKAFEVEKKRRDEFSRFTNISNMWEPIGPKNLQGRTISVAINPLNPNTVYIGTASGGLWRSFTGGLGNDWHQVRLGYPALGIGAIAIDPTDSNTIYIGTGETYGYKRSLGGLVIRTTRGSYGIGILKTVNGGATWTKSLDWSYNQERGVARLAINPLNHNTIYAATTEGIYKSVDAGATWNRVLDVILGKDIVINTLDTNKVMVSCGNFNSDGAAVYRTTNGGTSWLALGGLPSFTGKLMLCMYQANPNWVFASVGNDSTNGAGSLWRTTNFGDSWTMLCDNVSNNIFGVQGWYSHYVVVFPTDSNVIIHNAVNRSKSTDGGTSFSIVSSGYSDNHSYAIHPTNPNIIYVVNDDGIYRSTDFGSSYTNIGFGLQTGQIYNGFSCSTTDSFMAIGQSQDHIPGYKYTGSSTTWARSAVDEAGWTAIDPTNDNIVYALNRYGQYIYKSTNRGGSFSYKASFGSGAWNSPLIVSHSHPNVLYAGNLKIYKSTNTGETWFGTNSNIAPDDNFTLSMAMSFTNPDTVYVGRHPNYAHASILFTSNGGSSWVDITGSLPDRYPIDIAVDPTNSRIVYVAFGGFGSGHLYKSTNSGTSWSDITGTLPDIPTTAIAIDPQNPNNIYVGNDFGVYLSTDAGGNWMGFSEGLPDAVIVADLTISPSNRTVRVATHGNGVYERNLFNGTFPSSFDYRSLSFDHPYDGEKVIQGQTLTEILASVKNSGTQSQTDSFNVKYRILYNNTELFSSTKRIAGLNFGEIRQIKFDGSFAPPDTGLYQLQLIILAGDSEPSNDTLRGTITVILRPTIGQTQVFKIHSAYQEITGGYVGPTGDDAWMSLNLPFTFKFDNYDYDKVQICTNGWLEFGTGIDGTERGLSTSEQLGCCANQNGLLFSIARPTKLLGAWLDDLNADAPNSSVTYLTIGSSPDRIFVVQWKNVLAYYTQTTTRLNFQIRLYETSNVIEYHYGDVIEGTFSGSDIGAMIGLKDHLGGDYRFFDIALGRTGTINEGITNLSPLTNWPGADSCYRIYTGATTVKVQVNNRWNLISLPVQVQDSTVTTVFPYAIENTTYEYSNGQYTQKNILSTGVGYWTKFPGVSNLYIAGKGLYTIQISLKQGWNLIGSVDHEVPVPSGDIIVSNVFGYSSGYKIVNTIKPGRGYWVKASRNGTITLGASINAKNILNILDNCVEIIITDKLKQSQSLYLSVNQDDKLNIESFDMPPAPPTGLFDIRYASQRILEVVEDGKVSIYPIVVSSADYPLTVTTKSKVQSINLSILIDGKETSVNDNNSVEINNSKSQVSIKVVSTSKTPKEFSLEQNYPNPFNPSTVIRYQLPVISKVTLKIYNIIGQEVKVLVDEIQEAGYKSIEFDASSLASGIYLCHFHAGNFTSFKKMILVR